MVSKLVVVLVLAMLGFGMRRYIGLEKLWYILSLVLFYFSVPLTIFFSTASAPDIPLLLVATALAFVHMCAVAILSFITAAKLGSTWISIAVLASLPNALFLAIPLSEAILGSALPVLPHAIAFNGVLIIAIAFLTYLAGGERGVRASTRALPHILAFAVAIALRMLNVAPLLLSIDAIYTLKTFISYLNLGAFALIGAELASASLALRREIIYVAMLRYVVSPAILIAIVSAPTLPPIPSDMFLGMALQSVMPLL